MKRIILAIIAAITFTGIQAQPQEKQKFSKDEYKKNLREFIVEEAKLTKDDEAKFFPLYDEMKKKQREIYKQMRTLSKECPKTEKECENAIKKHDELELEHKKLQQAYNIKMMKAIPASKVFEAIKAEEKFHRKALNKFNQKQNIDRPKMEGNRPKPNGNRPMRKKPARQNDK